MLLVLLSSCATANVTTPTPQPPAATHTPDQDITLILWHGWSGIHRQVLGQLVDHFNAQHPNIHILLQSIPLASFAADMRAAVAAGGGPHLVLIPNSWIGSLNESQALLPLDDLIAPADREPLLPVTIGSATIRTSDGIQHLYGIPIAFDTLALYYNTANILAAPSTTTDLISAAHGLGAADATPPVWGLALNLSLDTTIGYLYAFGGRIFDDQGTFVFGSVGRDGAENWLAWLIRLNNDQQMLTRAENSIHLDRELKNGHVLMTFDWAHQIAVYRRLWGDHLGIATLPRLSETNEHARPYVATDLLALNIRVGPSERDAARSFIQFMISEEAQRDLLIADIQPARGDLTLDSNDAQQATALIFRSQAQQGLPMPNDFTHAIVWQELRLMQQRVLTGLVSPSDAITETDARLREKLNLPQTESTEPDR